MDFFFVDNFNKTKNHLGINLHVDLLFSVWEEIEDINSNKTIACDANTPIAQLSRLIISQYLCLSYSINNKPSHNRECIVISSIIENLLNTSFAIYRLAIDGLEYPAVTLLRTLYEQVLLFLNTIISRSKCLSFIDSYKADSEKTVWYKEFTAVKMQKTIEEYLIKYQNEEFIIKSLMDSLKERYSYLSGFTHNSFKNIYVFSYSKFQQDNNEKVYPNTVGRFATRTSEILFILIETLVFGSIVFTKALSDPEIYSSKDLLGINDTDSIWIAYVFLQELTKRCYLDESEKNGV